MIDAYSTLKPGSLQATLDALAEENRELKAQLGEEVESPVTDSFSDKACSATLLALVNSQ